MSSGSSRFTSLLGSLLEKTRVVLLPFSRLLTAERRDTAPIHRRSHSRASAAWLDLIPAVRTARRAGTVSGEINHLLTCYQISLCFSILRSKFYILDSNRAALHHLSSNNLSTFTEGSIFRRLFIASS